MTQTSTKPYLIRAIYEWCNDNGLRPYISVVVDGNTIVPMEFVRNGEIVLNVSADATSRLSIGNDLIEFEARFNRVARQVSIPIGNVSAVYAAESGHGMAFEVTRGDDESADGDPANAGEGEGKGEGEGETNEAGDFARRDPAGAGDTAAAASPAGLRVVGSNEAAALAPTQVGPAPHPGSAQRPALLEAVPPRGRTSSGKRSGDGDGSPAGGPDDDPAPKSPARRKPRLTRVK